MIIQAPISLTRKLANIALLKARARAPRSNIPKVHGADTLYAVAQEGSIGIGVPNQFKYMVYQDRGTKPHLQTELGGKVIPIRGRDGKIHFRYCDPNVIGKQITVRDSNGELVLKTRWLHPGITGTHYAEKAIRETIEEWKASVRPEELIELVKESPQFRELAAYLRKK